MNFRRAFVIVMTFFVSACNLYGVPPVSALREVEIEFNKTVYEKGGKAYVVLDANNNLGASFPVRSFFVFANENHEEFKLVVTNNEPAVYMLSPGNYTLTNFYVYGGMTSGNYSQWISLDFEDDMKGEFSVKAGESVYLGKIILKITNVKGPSAWAKYWGAKVGLRHVTYNTEIGDKYSEIKADKLEVFEEQSGKKPVVRLMKWSKK